MMVELPDLVVSVTDFAVIVTVVIAGNKLLGAL